MKGNLAGLGFPSPSIVEPSSQKGPHNVGGGVLSLEYLPLVPRQLKAEDEPPLVHV